MSLRTPLLAVLLALSLLAVPPGAAAEAPMVWKVGSVTGPGNPMNDAMLDLAKILAEKTHVVRLRGHPYGTVVVAATGIGLFLPPVGVGFFTACGIARARADRCAAAMMPYVLMMLLGLAVVIFVPWLTLVVPRLLGLA